MSPNEPPDDDLYLRNYAVLNVKDRLARYPAAWCAACSARATTPMRVWLDPTKVAAARGLTANEVDRRHPRQNRAGGGRRDRRHRRRAGTVACNCPVNAQAPLEDRSRNSATSS
ncbi:hypothetical protein ACU4HD_44095 [Cupriavidus basilensis]